MKIGILGAGALAIALCKVLENKGNEIILWTKFPEEKELIETTRENAKLFPGVKIHESIKITNDITEVIDGAEIIINVLPFIAVRDTIELLKPIYNKEQIILSTTKGIDEENYITTTDLFETLLGAEKVAALSGPSFAIEIANGDNISFMLGARDEDVANRLKALLETDSIKIEITDDIKGIQLAGGIKNAIAVGSGMLAGLKAADSTSAAYLACGIADMSKLLISLGGKKETAYTYAGIGDLILTCMSPTSRNFSFGYHLGQGCSIEEAFEKMNKKTVEGYKVIRAVHSYIKKNDIKLYTIDTLYNILFENGDVKQIKKI